MFTKSVALLTALLSLASRNTHAEDLGVPITYAGSQYLAIAKGGRALVFDAPVRVNISPTEDSAVPDCAVIDQRVSTWDTAIGLCETDPSRKICEQMARAVNLVRTEALYGGESYWAVSLNTTLDSQELARLKQAASQGVNTPTEAVDYYQPRSISISGGVSVIVNPTGKSSASKLSRLILWDDVAPEFDASSQELILADNVLACGILAGDVSFMWNASATATSEGQSLPKPLSATQLESVFKKILPMYTPAPTSPYSTLQAGAQIGYALAKAGVWSVGSAGFPYDEISFVDTSLFSSVGHTFNVNLTTADFRALTTPSGTTVEFNFSLAYQTE